MRGFMVRSQMFAVMLGLCALGMGGCAVQTASGDPSSTQTEEGRDPAGTSSSATSSGQVDDPSGGNLNPVHPVRHQRERAADGVLRGRGQGAVHLEHPLHGVEHLPATPTRTTPNRSPGSSRPYASSDSRPPSLVA